jgi:Flp pilus assembly protein TadB
MAPDPGSVLLASLLAGAFAACAAAEAVGLWAAPETGPLLPNDRARLERCRNNACYALFAPLVKLLAAVYSRIAPGSLSRLARNTDLLFPNSLTAAEVVALRQIQMLPLAAVTTWAAAWLLGLGSVGTVLLGLGAVAGFGLVGLKLTLQRARLYRRQFTARLPFALELTAIMMETGGTDLLEALRTTGEENRGHPMGDQLLGLIREIELGKSVAEALQDWSERFQDEDLSEAVLLIGTSLERGTPLEKSLRSLAEQARIRRLQRLERAAEECQVHCTWPGIVVMLACLIIVVAPFVLAARRELGW